MATKAPSSWARGIIGRVYAITDRGGKREAKVLLQGLTQPNGLAFKDGALYVFAINKVFRYDNIEDKLDNPGQGVELTEKYNLPDTIHHNWKYVAFGPDGKLYIQVGANCNICEINNGTHGQIRRYNADGSGMEIVARGVRNTVGFDWHPVTKELWFTDNGRDWAGNNGPEDELNRIAKGQEGALLRLPVLPRQRHARPGHQAAESMRRRDVAGDHRSGRMPPASASSSTLATCFPRAIRMSPSSRGAAPGIANQKSGFDVVVAESPAARRRSSRS